MSHFSDPNLTEQFFVCVLKKNEISTALSGRGGGWWARPARRQLRGRILLGATRSILCLFRVGIAQNAGLINRNFGSRVAAGYSQITISHSNLIFGQLAVCAREEQSAAACALHGSAAIRSRNNKEITGYGLMVNKFRIMGKNCTQSLFQNCAPALRERRLTVLPISHRLRGCMMCLVGGENSRTPQPRRTVDAAQQSRRLSAESRTECARIHAHRVSVCFGLERARCWSVSA